MSFTKKLVLWLAVVNILTFVLAPPSLSGWAYILVSIGTYVILRLHDERKFRSDFIISFGKWEISEMGARNHIERLASRIGQIAIAQERAQAQLVLCSTDQWERIGMLRRQIGEYGDSIAELKEEWAEACRLFDRRFPDAAGINPHWSWVEPYYTHYTRNNQTSRRAQ